MRQGVWGLFLAGVGLAALCDILKNCLHLWFLDGQPPQQDFWPALASHCARGKFAILICLVFAAGVLDGRRGVAEVNAEARLFRKSRVLLGRGRSRGFGWCRL